MSQEQRDATSHTLTVDEINGIRVELKRLMEAMVDMARSNCQPIIEIMQVQRDAPPTIDQLCNLAIKGLAAPSKTSFSEAERLSKKWLAAHPHAMMVVEHAGAMLRDALQPTASVPSEIGEKCRAEGCQWIAPSVTLTTAAPQGGALPTLPASRKGESPAVAAPVSFPSHERRIDRCGWCDQSFACYSNPNAECSRLPSVPSTTPRSETPRTDAVALGVAKYSNDDVKLREALAHGRDLERELAEVREGLRYSDAENDELRQENGALSAASATACSEAERYRWIRKNAVWRAGYREQSVTWDLYMREPDIRAGKLTDDSVAQELDAAIDSAMRAADGGKQTNG